MKKLGIALVLLFTLTGCLTPAKQFTPAQLESINRINFVNLEDLPTDKHIKIIGSTRGTYETMYGRPSKMEQQMKAGAFELNGDAILHYSTSRQYIRMTNTTIIHGAASVVKYIEPEKNTVLADYAKGYSGGYIALSAARFAGNYPESIAVSKNIIKQMSSYESGRKIVASALKALAKAKERDSIDFFFDYIINSSSSENAYSAFMAISPYINKQDKDKLTRFLKFHESDDIKIESARQLIKLGERKTVESYAEKTNNSALAKLLM